METDDYGIEIKGTEFSISLMSKIFFYMFLGLAGTGIIAWITYSSGWLASISTSMWYGLLIVEVAVVIIFSLAFRKLPSTVVAIMFFGYSMLNGITFSAIFYIFELNSIVQLFFASAVIFGVLGYIGATMKRDISNWGSILITVLIVGLILSVINLFIGNSMLDIILDWVILITFFGITIYDMYKIKNGASQIEANTESIALYYAMDLYLDFINIFIRILSIFGRRN